MYLDVAFSGPSVPVQNWSSRNRETARLAIGRLWARFAGRNANSESAEDPIIAAMLARLEMIDHEIDRVTRLALQEQHIAQQEAQLTFARDLQLEAREIRQQIRLLMSVPRRK